MTAGVKFEKRRKVINGGETPVGNESARIFIFSGTVCFLFDFFYIRMRLNPIICSIIFILKLVFDKV